MDIGGVGAGCSWDQLTVKFPQVTPSFMEMWVPTMASVAKKARVLPDGLKIQLKAMTQASKVAERVKVGRQYNIILSPKTFLCRMLARAKAKLSTW